MLKFEDLKFKKSSSAKFRTEFRITLRVSNAISGGYVGQNNWKLGFNKEEKANEALALLENLVATDPTNFLSVEMVRVPRVKGRISYSQAKKRGIKYRWESVDGCCPDLVNILNTMFEN